MTPQLLQTLSLTLLPLLAFAVTTEEEQARIARLEDAVLAPCCYTEPVSVHQSEIAVKMRLEIAKWVAAGKTDQEILDTYVRQYGSEVLIDPRTRPRRWMYWVPWLALATGVLGCVWLLHRWQARPVVAQPQASDAATELPNSDDDWI
jgi:cytochrome c-type biogenesis protein CcmH/NrfF